MWRVGALQVVRSSRVPRSANAARDGPCHARFGAARPCTGRGSGYGTIYEVGFTGFPDAKCCKHIA